MCVCVCIYIYIYIYIYVIVLLIDAKTPPSRAAAHRRTRRALDEEKAKELKDEPPETGAFVTTRDSKRSSEHITV